MIENYSSDDAEKWPNSRKHRTFCWRKHEPSHHAVTLEEDFSPPPLDFDNRTPITYFKLFWDDSIIKNIAEEFHVQETSTSIITTEKLIEQFLRIQMKLVVVHMPNYELYWTNGTRYEPIAPVCSQKGTRNCYSFYMRMIILQKRKQVFQCRARPYHRA